MTTPENQDPYAPPPRHRDKSGAVVRVAIVAVLLAGAAWGYLNLVNAPQTASLVPVAEEQTFAEARTPDSALQGSETLEPAPVAPLNSPATPATALEPAPPPATTIEPDAPPPTIDGASGD